MSDFKIGDRVRVVKHGGPSDGFAFMVGSTGTVDHVAPRTGHCMVKIDGEPGLLGAPADFLEPLVDCKADAKGVVPMMVTKQARALAGVSDGAAGKPYKAVDGGPQYLIAAYATGYELGTAARAAALEALK